MRTTAKSNCDSIGLLNTNSSCRTYLGKHFRSCNGHKSNPPTGGHHKNLPFEYQVPANVVFEQEFDLVFHHDSVAVYFPAFRHGIQVVFFYFDHLVDQHSVLGDGLDEKCEHSQLHVDRLNRHVSSYQSVNYEYNEEIKVSFYVKGNPKGERHFSGFPYQTAERQRQPNRKYRVRNALHQVFYGQERELVLFPYFYFLRVGLTGLVVEQISPQFLYFPAVVDHAEVFY